MAADADSRDALGGAVILGAAALAVAWANSPWQDAYRSFVEAGPWLGFDVEHWVNEVLLVVFFCVVGLEIKREVVDGELRDPRTAALPILGALGGMVVPAAIYATINAGGDGARGWGIPMATDIAIAVGVVGLVGRRLPPTVRLFLLTLAVVDDIGAVLVIAFFYSDSVALPWLAVAAVVAGAAVAAPSVLRRWPATAALVALALWWSFYQAGVHTTLAGVVLGLVMPMARDAAEGPGERLERALSPWSTFVVLPVFALVNAGVPITGDALRAASASRVTIGVAAGLLAGKALGICGAALGARAAGLGVLPAGMTPRHVVGVSLVAGVGFTVSLFVAGLAFEGSPQLADQAVIGVLGASVVAAAAGAALLRGTAVSSG